MLSNTAILIFSRLPQEEILHKRILNDVKANRALLQHLYIKTFEAAKKTGLPIIACSEKEQQGNTFAEKITNAIDDTLCKGYDNLIILGADCPEISKKKIETAYTQLLLGKEIVAGQDRRGGIYLLGLNKKVFKAKNFLAFNWQTNKLYKDIEAFASGFLFTKLKSFLNDINSTKDAASFLNFIEISTRLKLLLNTLLKTAFNIRILFSEHIQSSLFAFHYILRGPPTIY